MGVKQTAFADEEGLAEAALRMPLDGTSVLRAEPRISWVVNNAQKWTGENRRLFGADAVWDQLRSG